MLSSPGYTDARSIQRSKYSNVIFTDTPSPTLIKKFIFFLNENGHLQYQVTAEQLKQVAYIQIAHTCWEDVIGGSSIKYRYEDVAEIGYMLVGKKYRRQGIAESMTQSRINYARNNGIKILYAKIRGNNKSSIANLRKAGFQPADSFLNIHHNPSSLSWFYLPLQRLSFMECKDLLLKKLIDINSKVN